METNEAQDRQDDLAALITYDVPDDIGHRSWRGKIEALPAEVLRAVAWQIAEELLEYANEEEIAFHSLCRAYIDGSATDEQLDDAYANNKGHIVDIFYKATSGDMIAHNVGDLLENAIFTWMEILGHDQDEYDDRMRVGTVMMKKFRKAAIAYVRKKQPGGLLSESTAS
jgi:hypothetical protein